MRFRKWTDMCRECIAKVYGDPQNRFTIGKQKSAPLAAERQTFCRIAMPAGRLYYRRVPVWVHFAKTLVFRMIDLIQ